MPNRNRQLTSRSRFVFKGSEEHTINGNVVRHIIPADNDRERDSCLTAGRLLRLLCINKKIFMPREKPSL